MKRYLTTLELAERWGVSPGTLRNWRLYKRGPRFLKFGNLVRYSMTDIRKWEE